jgi:hypothetical protein
VSLALFRLSVFRLELHSHAKTSFAQTSIPNVFGTITTHPYQSLILALISFRFVPATRFTATRDVITAPAVASP